ncbi:hypothetical protein BWD42_07550 [Sphingobacterium sp. CZ-UAM]|uniref:RagB/SusD family nutrient uptake outer membrane protein n=1 Tax=Sphingobacterium sp. CZ-UAM TaxID=1933868 RepID=UPI0009CB61E9|nr:RagB/SusD family nutrient uptake outer membrane protein [Sphingobacterium sp. CZ-UAM]OOG19747.1 hypothetical protein BWD42_07550 [Sphingobacterium sp. CZ-UAM]
MKFKKLNYILLASTCLLSGCSKYLDKEPDLRASINDVDKVKRLVTSAYPANNYLEMAEMYSDNVEDKGVGELLEPVPSLYKWEDIIEKKDDTPTAYWNACYSAIAAANHALDAIEKHDFDETVLVYKGEALVARAYAHFMLVSFFAKVYDTQQGAANDSPGVPYVTAVETKVIVPYERGTVQAVYEQIQQDLEEGLALLEANKGDWKAPKYHFTPAAAHAFAARFYLFKGDWKQVVDHANKVFPEGNFAGKLMPFNSKFKDTEKKIVLENFARAEQPYNLLVGETSSAYARLYKSRYGMGTDVHRDIYNATTAAGARFYNFNLTYGPPHYTTYLWNEFFYLTNAAANTGYAMLMVPMLTTDEVLLNRAEAYAELGNTTASIADLDLFASNRIEGYDSDRHAVTVNKSKKFFQVTDEKEALIQTILQFKQIGFMSMGLRWFDIIRRKITVKHNLIANNDEETIVELKPEDPRRVFQIPQETKLSGVEPNPR